MNLQTKRLQTKQLKRRLNNLEEARAASVAIFTAGRDKPYALGLAEALIEQGIGLDFLGSTHVDSPGLRDHARVNFRMFRDQTEGVEFVGKTWRVLQYYSRLIGYAFTAKPKIFHILWNNYFEGFDRTVLMAFYRLCRRKVVLTVHNVNKGKRDGNDSWWNRLTLRTQYRLAHHLFVHTDPMRQELETDFKISGDKITVIPFGINSTVPDTPNLGQAEARAKLELNPSNKVLLFFGNIAPYKGLDSLVEAFFMVAGDEPDLRLMIVGKPKFGDGYWEDIAGTIDASPHADRVFRRIEYVPDEDTEIYFKAADVLIIPYTHIFQSGVLFLGYNFGLPVLATDVGSLKDDIVEGETGFVCRPRDAEDLAQTIRRFFDSPLYAERAARRRQIRAFAAERYSWTKVGELTRKVYEGVG